MAVNLTNDNIWVNDQGQNVLEIEGGTLGHTGPTHFFLPDGAETTGQKGVNADRFVFIDIEGNQLNTYVDDYHAPDGTRATTLVTYDNSSLPSWPQAISHYFNQLVYNAATFNFAPLAVPSIFRHSNTYDLVQIDGHGNTVEEHFTNGRLDGSGYTYADGSFVADRFDKNGVLTYHQVGPQGHATIWQLNSNGSWTKQVDNGSSTILAAADAIQQVANDAATRWTSGSVVITPSNGQLVLNEGDLLINKNFQYLIGHDGGSLIGQDAAGLIGHDGGSLIGHDGGSLISEVGAGTISLQAANLIGHDGGSLIGHDGGSLLGQDGASLIGHDGGSLIGHDGGSLIAQFAAALNANGHTVGTRLVDALVFADANFNGQFDAGELWTTTDANGAYSLPGATGPLVVIGGTDAGTNLPFKGSMEAPGASSIISPLTTLTTELWKQVGSADQSMNTVDAAFALGSADLTTLDPVAGIQNGDAASASVYVAGAKVFDTISLMAGTLSGMGATDNLAIENAIVQAMVGDLAQTSALNLGDIGTVAALFTTAASSLHIDGSAIAGSIADIVVSTNAQLDAALSNNSVDSGLLDALAGIETKVQGSITSDLSAAAGDPGKIADIASTNPDQTPTSPDHSGPPKWMASVDVGAHPAGWSPMGIGDFNHDASGDLAWFNSTTGDVDIWELANGHWSASSDVGSHPAGYQPVRFGDYNHDGTRDVLWFNPTTHDVDLWEMSNGKWSASVDVGTHPAGYAPVGSGDFNGDGTSDVLWYNAATHDVDLWDMSNGHWSASVDVGSHPAGYQPSVIGDFNGDHTSDIAWFNPTSGDLDIWEMSNGHWSASVDVGAHPAGYQPLGAADLNHDGTGDIVWYNPTTNDIDVWLLNDGHWSASVDLGAHPAGAVPVGLGDFDHNGVPDLMWQDTASGHIDNWMLTLG